MAPKTDLVLSFFDNADAVIYLKDEQGRFVLMNRRAAELAGLSKEEFVKKKQHTTLFRKMKRTALRQSIERSEKPEPPSTSRIDSLYHPEN